MKTYDDEHDAGDVLGSMFEGLRFVALGWQDRFPPLEPRGFADSLITTKEHATGGHQWVFRFENGYGASVVRNGMSYGHDDGLFEIAVLEFDGEDWSLTYDTPITSDVIGGQTQTDVREVLARIKALPPATEGR